MGPQDLKSELKKEPFQPFRIVTTCGKTYGVTEADRDMLLVLKRVVVIGLRVPKDEPFFDRLTCIDRTFEHQFRIRRDHQIDCLRGHHIDRRPQQAVVADRLHGDAVRRARQRDRHGAAGRAVRGHGECRDAPAHAAARADAHATAAALDGATAGVRPDAPASADRAGPLHDLLAERGIR